MGMLKFGHASVSTPVVCPGKWVDRITPKGRIVTAKDVIAKYDPSEWLLSHVTIMAAVDVDLADPSKPKSNYLIKPEYSIFVNNNGDSWERKLLASASQSFIGADNYCFLAGTRVLMFDGIYKPIEDVKEGDKVINRKGEIGKVTKTYKHQANNLLEVSGDKILSRRLYVTKEHPFWVYHARETCPKTGKPNFFNKDKDFYHLNKWVGFSVGVHKAAGERYPIGLVPDWVEAGNLNSDRDFFTHPISNIEISNEEINENRAELIGWFLAEGFYDHKNNSSEEESGVTFALGNDETDVAERLSLLLIKEFGESFRDNCAPRIYESQSGSYTLTVSNAKVAQFFKKWCGKYAWAKRLPEEAMFLSKKLQAIIIKHCINGDGCGEHQSRGYSIELKSRDLIQQFNWMMWRLGLLPTYKEVGVLPRYTDCEIVGGFEIYTDPLTGKRSRPGYFIRLSTRDSKRLNEIVGCEDERISNRQSKKIAHIFREDDASWLISKIDYLKEIEGTFDVYNIEVEGDNSYVVEGVTVHNCEHVQIPELSKGKVIDLALRNVPFAKDKDGKDLDTLYVDILIATNKKHTDLIEKIQSGEYGAVSMGCLIKYSQCSQCGRIAEDESQACKHIRYFKNNFFYDKNGIKRIIAELCGRAEEPDSCKFIDASWVRKPAFEGAVKNKILELDGDLSDKLMKAVSFPSFEYQPGMYLKAASQTAIDIVNEIEAQEGDNPKPPADDVGFPEAPPESKKPIETETPSEDAPLGEGDSAAPDADSLGDLAAPGGGAGGGEVPPPEPQIEEPKEDATVQEVKDLVKNQILNEIRREILKEQASENTSEQRPTDLETSTNNNLVKDASFRKIFASAKKIKNDRLYNGLMILSNLKNWNQFKRYGYNHDDVLGILHFVDRNISTSPVGIDAIKTLSRVKLGSDGLVPFFTKMIVEIGRKPGKIESKKIASWAKILRNF